MANGDRKVFADSVTPLPAAEGPTHLGLMVAKARPETSKEQMTVVFSLALPDSAQADLQKMVAEGRTVSPAQLNKKYAADANDAKALTSWLKSQGFKIEKVSPDRTSEVLHAAFGMFFCLPGRAVRISSNCFAVRRGAQPR